LACGRHEQARVIVEDVHLIDDRARVIDEQARVIVEDVCWTDCLGDTFVRDLG